VRNYYCGDRNRIHFSNYQYPLFLNGAILYNLMRRRANAG
jgi:hypothetical protein